MEISYLHCAGYFFGFLHLLWHSYCIQAYMPLLGGNMWPEGPMFWIPLQERWPVFPEFHQLRVQLRRLRLFRSRLCNFSPLSVLCSVSSIHQIHWASAPGLSWYRSATIITKSILSCFRFFLTCVLLTRFRWIWTGEGRCLWSRWHELYFKKGNS